MELKGGGYADDLDGQKGGGGGGGEEATIRTSRV